MIANFENRVVTRSCNPQISSVKPSSACGVVLDISRLLEKSFQATPTGIDRVELAYARRFLAQPHCYVRFVASLGGAPRAVSEMAVRQLVAAKDKAWRDGAGAAWISAWSRLCEFLTVPAGLERMCFSVAREKDAALAPASALALNTLSPIRAAPPRDNEHYLNVSHVGVDRPSLRRWLGARRGVFLLHDLIPISFPEYVREWAPRRHVARLDTIQAHADLILTNSRDTRDALLTHVNAQGAEIGRHTTKAHIAAIPLGVEQSFRPGVARLLTSRPYFVCVATVEPRKNHVFLLQLWQRLHAQLGNRTPRLVLIGRRGWENENAVDMIERGSGLQSLVHEAGSLPDRAMARIVAGAQALVLPSLAEGFGLPVAEALAMGVPVLASDLPALREVSAGAAELLDPLDGRAWLHALIDYTDSTCLRRQTQLARAARYRAPRWDRHFAIVNGLLGLSLPADWKRPC